MCGEKIIQWVSEQNVPIKVIKVGDLLNADGTFNEKSLTEMEGFAEKTVDGVDEGQIVQFGRFGFCRLDSKNNMKFISVSK